MKLTVIIFFIAQTVFGQIARDSISKWTTIFNLHPLSKVDTTSKKIANNISTQSGWHIDYYARPANYNGINLYKVIYNDNIWFGFWTTKNRNYGQIAYDTVKVFKESATFLYIKTTNFADTSENILILSKKSADVFFEFYNLLHADYDNNIFIEYSSTYCQASNILHFKITNINSGKCKEIKFSSGICVGGKNNWCIDKINYLNGVLTIAATVINKRTKKEVIEIQQVKI